MLRVKNSQKSGSGHNHGDRGGGMTTGQRGPDPTYTPPPPLAIGKAFWLIGKSPSSVISLFFPPNPADSLSSGNALQLSLIKNS
ncbi:unnamed protein product [Nezara viridula]|uniref:Uncharacterized protein n=1 Tax=Nezara viridula TaxID=85310 RepID=A0A9P0MV60_NEZVI|nr:unnamed protein product [Nezara viridula]